MQVRTQVLTCFLLRQHGRSDGSTYHAVLYRLNGKQTSISFEHLPTAIKFRTLTDKFGPAKALEIKRPVRRYWT